MRQLLLIIVGVVLLAGCDWVKMDQGAAQVRVVPLGQAMASCHRLGEVAVSVKDRVGPYERSSITVRDELETLARNEALTLHADTVQPVAEPADGQQHWIAYRCQGAN
ncbi:MAG TPA: DUF4156 domain-containing protein [Xanthomonadaceae bacterium]|nr:DUF4156 domain-containing protein [Xanthomonadaceae bacterium]